MDKEEFALKKEDINLEQEVMKETSEVHENHFAMVENFVEKYMPIRIQSQLSETLRALLSPAMIDKLDDYEEKTFAKFHSKILDDDGIPELIGQMRAIKFEIDTIYDIKYKGLKHINIREQAIERFN